MKKFTFTIYLFSISILCPAFIYAQDDCSGSFTEYYLNSNHIRASFFPRGNKFTNGSNPGFLVPYPSMKKVSTIFASSPWIGGLDAIGNVRLAVETYPGTGTNDYSVGPLTTIGTINDTICGKFDQVWSVYYEDIKAHQLDYFEDFKIDDTILSIFTWPGRGNKFFESYYGFELPFDNYGLAPFHDINGNTIYDPENGDYPDPQPHSTNSPIPDQMLWMVFNDLDTNEVTGHRPLRFEIQLTAYAFHCQDNEILNNTIFNSYRILYRGLSVLDSVFFGMWTDYDLGCYLDDGIGSDSMRRTEFAYNIDDKDGDEGLDCSNGADTYAEQVPIQSMTYLNYPMHSFITAAAETDQPIEFYRQLNGEWPDGTPLTPEGDGNNPGSGLSPTKFLFNGDPRDTTSWATINDLPEGADQKIISSVYFGRMNPGAVREVITAYMFHYDSSGGYFDQFTRMYSNVDSLLGNLDYACTPFPFCDDNDCVWPGDFDKNGIADHRDYLMWGVMNGLSGPGRNGLVSWRGHFGEDWNEELVGINSKHGDADGNGEVNLGDIDINRENFLLTNKDYLEEANYPIGTDIVLTANPTIEDQGRVRNFAIRVGHDLDNVLGLTFELEFDTAQFILSNSIVNWPGDEELIYRSLYDPSSYFNASYVQTNNTGITLDSNYLLLRSLNTFLSLKPGLPIPDSTIIRLRNLKAITPDGTDLLIGSEPLVIYREGFTAASDPGENEIRIYPNPARDYLVVDVPNDTEGEIINVQGQVMKKVLISSMKPVDVSALSPGVYYLRLQAYPGVYKVIIY